MRLQVALSHAGIASRRKSAELIRRGSVTVNGRIVTQPGFRVDPGKDEILCGGKRCVFEKPVYLVINKPKGVITTKSDSLGRKTVFDILPKLPCRLYHVGRLDRDSSGLLLLTNDGEVAYRLTHPKHEIERVYDVVIAGLLIHDEKRRLERGIYFDGKRTSPCRIEEIKTQRSQSLVRVTLHEGKKRQLRRMFEIAGHPVMRLERIGFGPLALGKLRPGEFRFLGANEIKRLKSALGINGG